MIIRELGKVKKKKSIKTMQLCDNPSRLSVWREETTMQAKKNEDEFSAEQVTWEDQMDSVICQMLEKQLSWA